MKKIIFILISYCSGILWKNWGFKLPIKPIQKMLTLQPSVFINKQE